jgi:hypothetical protein
MNLTLTDASDWIKSHRRLLIAVVAIVVMLSIFWRIASWINDIDNKGFNRQRDVVKEYNIYQTQLSTCLDNTNISSQIAQAEYEQVKNALTAIVAARYKDANGQPTRADSVLGGGALISALQEQYPEIDRSLWKQFMNTAIGCRNQVAGEMGKLQYVAGNFDTWANTGGLIEKRFRGRYPTDELKVIGLNGPLTGRPALEFLTQPVLTSDATNAVRTHEMPSQDLFPDTTPTK